MIDLTAPLLVLQVVASSTTLVHHYHINKFVQTAPAAFYHPHPSPSPSSCSSAIM